jgi:hypothetical protein
VGGYRPFFAKNEGYTIKKGSKAFPVWSQPTKREKKEQDGENEPAPTPALMENANGTGEEDSTRRHGGSIQKICCLRHVERTPPNSHTTRLKQAPSKAQAPIKRRFAPFFMPENPKKNFPAIRREKYGGIPYRQMTAADWSQQHLLRRHFSVTPYLFYI